MRFKIDVCPRCGEIATAIVQKVWVQYAITREPSGEWDYDGERQYFDEGAEDLVEGKTTLRCLGSHDWETDEIGGAP